MAQLASFVLVLHGILFSVVPVIFEKRMCFISPLELARASEWDNIVTCHMGVSRAFTWNMSKKALGEFQLNGDKNAKSTVSATTNGLFLCEVK